ncbi:uncharacterized protein [Procambarus clarkii]|uniref:uncharacterized protein isoform X1 n=1 Tax=Procambarus clarkii TaxID=6728 RepID=UPI003742229D
MLATLPLVVTALLATTTSAAESPGQPPCQTYTTIIGVWIPVPEDQHELDLWFSFQQRDSEVNIAVVTTKGEQALSFMLTSRRGHRTRSRHNSDSSSSHDEENTSWCRVRLTQAVEGVNNSRLSAAGQCGDNSKEKEYTRDDVTALLVNMKYGNIDFTVCLVPPHPVCPTGTWRPRGNSRPVEPPVSNTSQCPTACPEQQELQQGVTVVLGAVLAACLLDVVVTSAVLCVIRHITD